MALDLIIRNARICDGTGAPSWMGAVGIRDGKIVTVGDISRNEKATRTLDAGGLALAPGFIDPHTHFDAQLAWDGRADPSLAHGVTTIVTGNCSLSLAPVRLEHRALLGATFRKIEEMPKNAFDAGLRWNWQTFGEYLHTIRGALGINVAPLVGHSLLRLWVMGEAARERPATDAEIAAMQQLLATCLAEGAIGMSGSWVDIDHEHRPVPARLAEPRELDALCATLGAHGATLQIVPEFWDADLLCARIDLMADLSRRHDITITFSPLFDSNSLPDLVDIAYERLRLQAVYGARVVPQMQTRPIDLSFDLLAPLSTFATLPVWWATVLLPKEEKMAKFREPAHRAKLVAEMQHFMMPIGLNFSFGDAFVKMPGKASKALVGRPMGEIAAERGCDVAEAIIDIALADDLQTSFGLEAIGHDKSRKIARFLADPLIGIGAGDGGAHVTNFSTYGDTGYLFSEYVRKLGALTVEQAVQRLTSDVAKVWGMHDRGFIKPGQAADLVLFDPETIGRGPEFAAHDLPAPGYRFMRHATGVQEVFVNGACVYRHDSGYTEARPGNIVQLAA